MIPQNEQWDQISSAKQLSLQKLKQADKQP